MLMQTDRGSRAGLALLTASYPLIAALFLIAVAAVGFGHSLLELVHRWRVQEEYSYGFLIPVIVAWLLWSRRQAIVESLGQPSWIGPSLILIAGALHVVGRLSALFFLSQFGFVLIVLGIVLSIGGRPLLKVVAIPVLFLILAIPMPYVIDSSLSWRLQIVSSQLGVFFIRLAQIPVFLQGNVIDLGNYKLQVVDACSGLRYLYPLLSLSFLAAYLFQGRLWQRALIFLSAIPITIIMNSFRIGLVGVLVDHWGPQDADGALHMFEGWVIFLACACILVGEMALLARFNGDKGLFDMFYAPTISPPAEPLDRGRGIIRWAPAASCAALVTLVGLAGFFVATRQEIRPERKVFASFPMTLANWKGRSSTLSADTLRVLDLSDYLLANYVKSNGLPVNLYVAYYNTQHEGASPHSPSVCIPGNGWRITEFSIFHYRHNGISLPINRAIIMREGHKQLVYYWYAERGRSVASEYLSKLLLLKDAILINRTDGALIRLTTSINAGEAEQDADRRLQAFINVAVPALAQYLPTKSGKLAKAETPLKSARR